MRALYQTHIAPSLMQTLQLYNPMQVPRIKKITLNMGVGEAAHDRKLAQNARQHLTDIAGQLAVITLSRKSIAAFKIRDHWPIGCKVTLRGDRMYEFLDRLLSIALPRIRDFRGLNPRSFDGKGNYNLGIKEHIVFPEIEYDKVDAMRGLDIAITTSALTNAHALALLKAFRFPFREMPASQQNEQGD